MAEKWSSAVGRFCWCGAGPEMFRDYAGEIKAHNDRFIELLDALAIFLALVMLVSNLFTAYVSMLREVCAGFLCFYAAEQLVYRAVGRVKKRRVNLGVWFCMGKAVLFAFFNGIFFNRGDVAFSFYIFLIAMPLLFLKPTWKMVAFITAACGLFSALVWGYKPPEVAAADLYYTFITWLCAVAVFYWVSALRLHSIHTERQLIRQRDTDALTGLYNRLCFNGYITRAFEAEARLGLMMLDVDHFKRYNDQNGHLAGDRALETLGTCFRAFAARHNLFFARYGGEEFVAVDRCCSPAKAAAMAQMLLREVRACAVPHAGAGTGTLTVSIGWVSRETAGSPDYIALLNEADRALYAAKAAGRDRAVGADELRAAEEKQA